jgi:hypothetical protein
MRECKVVGERRSEKLIQVRRNTTNCFDPWAEQQNSRLPDPVSSHHETAVYSPNFRRPAALSGVPGFEPCTMDFQ